MAMQRNRITSDTLKIRIESGKLILADTIASRIVNMVPTVEGTLRSINGPTPYMPAYRNFVAPAGWLETNDLGRMHGVFHALLKTRNRDLLLIHCENRLLAFNGWWHSWEVLIGEATPTVGTPQIEANLVDDAKPRFPTQFEATDQGVIIVPQEGRAYFYDGEVILPLGYATAPGPPTGYGPRSTKDHVTFSVLTRGTDGTGASGPDTYEYGPEIDTAAATGEADPLLNNEDYAHDAQTGFKTAMHEDFGLCRVGTVEQNPGQVGVEGIIVASSYRAAIQWVDRWGNLSPVGGRSAEVYITEQPAFTYEGGSPGEVSAGKVDIALKQIAWGNIEAGREGTIGRMLHRTKDQKHSGTLELFQMGSYAAEGNANFASIPDNITTLFTDNVPDSWLLLNPIMPIATPEFRLTKVAFGRHFIANVLGAPGMVRWSMPHRWGTFLEHDFVFPDATGQEVTGLWRVSEGLLVFTATSTFLIVRNSEGTGFRSSTMHPTIGCVAPNSIATMDDERTIWLGREGFYVYDGTSVSLLSESISPIIQTLNKGRLLQATAAVETSLGEYRCWVPQYSGTNNNLCLIFDGEGWRERNRTQLVDVCVTRDHRHYMIGVGEDFGVHKTPLPSRTEHGVWVLDHEVNSYTPQTVDSIIDTAWLTSMVGKERATSLTAYLWLRETKSQQATNPNLTIDVFRDWREKLLFSVDTQLVPEDDVPPLYGETLAGSGEVWERRRPYWVRAMLYIPSCEVFKLRLRNAGDWEFLGLVFDEQPKPRGGTRTPP